MKKVLSVLVVALMVMALVVVVGCDQKVKQENEQLKAKVASLEKDKADLDGKLNACQADLKKATEKPVKPAPKGGKAAPKGKAK